jgi:hypothetical protein
MLGKFRKQSRHKNKIMKLKNKLLIMAVAFGALNVVNVRADGNAEVLKTFNLKLTTYAQGAETDDGTTRTIAPNVVKHYTTANLLSALANDKLQQGLWPSNSFPKTAKLAGGDNAFLVVNGTNVLVDVSDIISAQVITDSVKSGKQNDATGLASPNLKRMELVKVTVDDSAITNNSGLNFYIQGIAKESETDTAPTPSGVYSQTQTIQLINGTGEGTDSDTNHFLCVGSLTATGHGTLVLPP